MSELGTKYICKCGCKFYDLNRPEAICPRCEINLKKNEKKSKHGKLLKEVVDASYVPPAEDEKEASDKPKDEEDNVTPEKEAKLVAGVDAKAEKSEDK